MMEQQLKERLVGATVLVLLAIILIPVVLDGPGGSNGKVEKRLELPASGDNGERRTVRIPLDRPGSENLTESPDPVKVTSEGASSPTVREEETPVTDTGKSPSGLDDAEDRSVVPAKEPDVSPAVKSTAIEAEATDTADPWTVQVGSFSNEGNAASLVKRLKSLGYDDAHISRFDDGSRIHYRVRVGGYPDRDAAARRAAEIRERSGEPARPAQN